MYRAIIIGLIAGVMIFFMGSCSAQTEEERQDKTEQTESEKVDIIDVNNQYCPISGEKINDEYAVTYVHEGKRYRFCCAACISSFKKNPEKYIKIIEEEIQPPTHEYMH